MILSQFPQLKSYPSLLPLLLPRGGSVVRGGGGATAGRVPRRSWCLDRSAPVDLSTTASRPRAACWPGGTGECRVCASVSSTPIESISRELEPRLKRGSRGGGGVRGGSGSSGGVGGVASSGHDASSSLHGCGGVVCHSSISKAAWPPTLLLMSRPGRTSPQVGELFKLVKKRLQVVLSLCNPALRLESRRAV